jgi:uncharacterized membrane protein
MKKLFFTGLVILLPFTLTLLIVGAIISFLTTPFQGPVESLLDYYDLLDRPFLFLSGETVLYLSSKIVVILVLVSFIILIGFLGRLVIVKKLFEFGNAIISRIPIVNRVYQSVQDLVYSLFNSQGSSFSQVALVPFPHSGVYAMGLLTKKQTVESHAGNVLVFVPGTPNPTAGFMLSYRYQDVIILDMKVEDGLKFIVSCGIALPGTVTSIES